MRQSATVVSTKGNIAEIRVERASMCDGCVHKNCDGHTCAAGGLLGAGKTMVTRAYNEIGAEAGDVVTVETATKKVLSYAALVFLMPILACAVFYAIGNAVFQSQTGAYGMAGGGFVLSFFAIAAVERHIERRRPDIVIRAVVKKDGDMRDIDTDTQ